MTSYGWMWWQGYVTVRLRGPGLERLLNKIADLDIGLHKVERLTADVIIIRLRSGFPSLASAASGNKNQCVHLRQAWCGISDPEVPAAHSLLSVLWLRSCSSSISAISSGLLK